MTISEKHPIDVNLDSLLYARYLGLGGTLIQSKKEAHLNADLTWVCTNDGRITGSLSVFNIAAISNFRKALVIGAFESLDSQSSDLLLNQAMQQAKRQGFTEILGPLNGNTWNDYRLNITNAQPVFPGEPFNPKQYVSDFERNAFIPLKTYSSSTDTELSVDEFHLRKQHDHFENMGVVFRGIDKDNLVSDIQGVIEVSSVAFKNNFLFSEPNKKAIAEKYQRMLTHMNSDLITIAEHSGKIVAFMFAYPNPYDVKGESAVIKTVARLPDSEYQGIGQLLVADATKTAKESGFKRIIHALMPDESHSNVISNQHSGETSCRYVLYHKIWK